MPSGTSNGKSIGYLPRVSCEFPPVESYVPTDDQDELQDRTVRVQIHLLHGMGASNRWTNFGCRVSSPSDCDRTSSF